MVFITMRHHLSRRGTPRRDKRPTATVAVNGIAMGAWCARMVVIGGGIFAETAKTPPLQSGVCGEGIAIRITPKGRPLPPPCAYHATPPPPMSPWFYNDAARRVATVFE